MYLMCLFILLHFLLCLLTCFLCLLCVMFCFLFRLFCVELLMFSVVLSVLCCVVFYCGLFLELFSLSRVPCVVLFSAVLSCLFVVVVLL